MYKLHLIYDLDQIYRIILEDCAGEGCEFICAYQKRYSFCRGCERLKGSAAQPETEDVFCRRGLNLSIKKALYCVVLEQIKEIDYILHKKIVAVLNVPIDSEEMMIKLMELISDDT